MIFKNFTTRIICRRENYTGDFKKLLHNVEAFIQPGEKLKDDAATTITKVKLNNKFIAIKRYNIKNLKHLIKNLFRRSRASRCWENANLLLSNKILTPKPLAIIEKKFGFLRLQSYYIMEYINGTYLNDYTRLPQYQNERLYYLKKLVNIFKVLKKINVRHRDSKEDNFVIANQDLYLFDLDDMKKMSKLKYYLFNIWQRDSKRLLKNWDDNLEAKQIVANLLKEK